MSDSILVWVPSKGSYFQFEVINRAKIEVSQDTAQDFLNVTVTDASFFLRECQTKGKQRRISNKAGMLVVYVTVVPVL